MVTWIDANWTSEIEHFVEKIAQAYLEHLEAKDIFCGALLLPGATVLGWLQEDDRQYENVEDDVARPQLMLRRWRRHQFQTLDCLNLSHFDTFKLRFKVTFNCSSPEFIDIVSFGFSCQTKQFLST